MVEINKKVLRKQVLVRRDALSAEERERAKFLITERICGHQWFYLSDTILGFVNYGSEIATTDILAEAFAAGKKVYLPKVVEAPANTSEERGSDGADFKKESVMEFYRVTSLDELQEGYKGIREPKGDTEVFVYEPEHADNVLMLMPGAVFDKQRNRIGYGKGFYDRYLSEKEELKLRTIAIGYQCQMVEELPAEEWDIRPYQVICV